MLKLATLAVIVLAAAPAFAQVGTTRTPPDPNADSSTPQPTGSVPQGGLTSGPAVTPYVGGPVGGANTAPNGPAVAPNNPSGAAAATVPTPR